MRRKGKEFSGVTRVTDRHGKARWRLRKTINGRKVDAYLPGRFGSHEFRRAYYDAIEGNAPSLGLVGTVGHAVETYFQTRKFKTLASSTQKDKRRRLEFIRRKVGDFQLKQIEPMHVQQLMDLKGGDFAAIRLHKDLGELYRFAKTHLGYKGPNPIEGVERPRTKSKGFHTWSDDEVAQYRAKHAKGTSARLILELAIATGAARADLAAMGRLNLRGGAIRYARIKTGGEVELPLALLPDLAAELTPVRDQDTFLTNAKGNRHSEKTLGALFTKFCDDAGLPSTCRLHGLRKYGATRLAEHGASEFQVMAFLGHESPQEARKYVAAANTKTLVAGALRLLPKEGKLSNLGEGWTTNFPKPLSSKEK